MKMFLNSENGTDALLSLEIVYSRLTADIHVLDLGSNNMALMQTMGVSLQCRILEALGEKPTPGLWKWFLYAADGIISWYDEEKFNPVRAMDEHLLVPRFVKIMESRCCQWYGEGRVK